MGQRFGFDQRANPVTTDRGRPAVLIQQCLSRHESGCLRVNRLSRSEKARQRSTVRSNPPPAPKTRDPIQTNPAKPRNAQHFEELEAYRGVAALMIVVFHAYQYSRQATHQPKYVYEGTSLHHLIANLEAGVAWFFALSGFLLFLPIARYCIRQTPRPSTRSFLVRRAIRILPLYYFAILVVWCWRFTGGPGQWRDLFNHLTFTHIFSDRPTLLDNRSGLVTGRRSPLLHRTRDGCSTDLLGMHPAPNGVASDRPDFRTCDRALVDWHLLQLVGRAHCPYSAQSTRPCTSACPPSSTTSRLACSWPRSPPARTDES